MDRNSRRNLNISINHELSCCETVARLHMKEIKGQLLYNKDWLKNSLQYPYITHCRLVTRPEKPKGSIYVKSTLQALLWSKNTRAMRNWTER